MLLRKVNSRKNKTKAKGRAVGAIGTVSGAGSIISAHNVCHSVCLGVVAVLSVFGIAASSTALMFLQDYNLLFWSMGAVFLLISLALYSKFGKCISTKMIAFNAGLVIAGTPFVPAAQLFFWITGFSVAVLVSGIYVANKMGVSL